MTQAEVAAAEPKEETANVKPSKAEQKAPEKEKTGLQEALLAERRKRQEAEYKSRVLEQQLTSHQRPAQQEEEEDEYTRDLKQYTESKIQTGIKQALEREYLAQNSYLLEQDPVTGQSWMEAQLAPILQKKPYLADVIQTAENRYARAVELINDFTPEKHVPETEKRLEENQAKPGNPAGLAKTGSMDSLQHLKNMSRKDFSKYRAQVRGRAPNIR